MKFEIIFNFKNPSKHNYFECNILIFEKKTLVENALQATLVILNLPQGIASVVSLFVQNTKNQSLHEIHQER